MATKQSANFSTKSIPTKVSVGQPGNTKVSGKVGSGPSTNTGSDQLKGTAVRGFNGGTLKSKL